MVKEIDRHRQSEPFLINLQPVPAFQYNKTLQNEIDAGSITRTECLALLEQMLMIRAFEEMIAELVAFSYKPLPERGYSGPTHISTGQEAATVGAVGAMAPTDFITSSHRGHGDAIAKAFTYIKGIGGAELAGRLAESKEMLARIGIALGEKASRAELEETALRLHVYRMICELFGKADGFCRGVGGSMHIADFKSGHLGANAIVGGHMGIAAGAGMSARHRASGQVVMCITGDGSYANGIAHESLSISTMAQFENGLMKTKSGVPIIFAVMNNHYAMSAQTDGEISGIDYVARRGSAYHVDGLHAEVVDGMNILAVRDAANRAAKTCRDGHGPVLVEFMTYRFKGHSLSDPQAYRTREEIQHWLASDPVNTFPLELLKAKFPPEQGGEITEQEIHRLEERVRVRNAEMAVKAHQAAEPAPETLVLHLYARPNSGEKIKPAPLSYKKTERKQGGLLSYRFALREALAEEMVRDERVLLLGEDIAEYGGAFGVTRGLIETFGRDRIFNTSISECAIVGSAIGMAMTGLRPVCEIMYHDFILEAMDQIGNQAAKWSYMSGGQLQVPLVIRTAQGGGRGYAGQHSQCLESICTHMPGLIVVCPSNAYDAKGLLKSAIREPNPVVFVEHQQLYGLECVVPEDEYLVPLGKASVRREGTDATIVTWGWPVHFAEKSAASLATEGVSVEVIDVRTLWPLDIDTILKSVRKTGRCLVVSQAVEQGSFTGEIASKVAELAFDDLKAPVMRLGAPNCVSPCAQSLEKAYLVDDAKIIKAIREGLRLG